MFPQTEILPSGTNDRSLRKVDISSLIVDKPLCSKSTRLKRSKTQGMEPSASSTPTSKGPPRKFGRKKVTIRGSENVQNAFNTGQLTRLTATDSSANELRLLGRIYLQRRALYYPRTGACALELMDSANATYGPCRAFLDERLSDIAPVRVPARVLATLFTNGRRRPSDQALAASSVSALWSCIAPPNITVPNRVLRAAFRLTRPRQAPRSSRGRGALANDCEIIFDFVSRTLQKSVNQPLQASAMVPSVAQCIVKMTRFGPRLLKELARRPHKDLSQVFIDLGLVNSVVRFHPAALESSEKGQAANSEAGGGQRTSDILSQWSNNGTIYFLHIRDALKKTRDPSYVFGTGSSEVRDCPAKLAVSEFARAFHEEIRRVKGIHH